MLVRAVHIHQLLAQGGKELKRRWRPIDELPVGSGSGQDAFEDQLMVGACFQAIILEKGGRDGAAVGAGRAGPG